MPFDGKRMIMGGFDAIVEEGSERGGYTDGFVVPVPEGKKDAYRELASKMAKVFREHGANRVVEAIADDVQHGKVTDFYRAVKAEDGENGRLLLHRMARQDRPATTPGRRSWPTRAMKPEGDMPFSGQRMFWGGFEPILDSTPAKTPENA